MSSERHDLMVIGRLTAVYGVRGWVKVHAFGDNPEQIFTYQPWYLPERDGQWRQLEIDEWRTHGKGLVAHIAGVDDREVARELCQRDVFVPIEVLPELPAGEYYWRDLIGLRAVTTAGVDLGVVDTLLATGANDVLVIAADQSSCDDRERLLPYSDSVVQEVDLDGAQLRVDWDPEF